MPVARQSPAVVLSCKCTNKAIIFPRNFTWRCVPAPSSFQKSAESSFLPVLCDRCRDILLEKLWTDFTALSNILCPSEVWNPQIDMLNATSVVYLSWIAIKKAVVSSSWVLLRTERIPSVRKIFLGWCWICKELGWKWTKRTGVNVENTSEVSGLLCGSRSNCRWWDTDSCRLEKKKHWCSFPCCSENCI